MNLKYSYIAIEGNIGAGKTSLARKLSQAVDGNLTLEEFENNPFLAKFYASPDDYTFQLELSFLADRYKQMKSKLQASDLFGKPVISDYVLDKSIIFAQNNLEKEEFLLFRKMHSILYAEVPQPDCILFLQRSIDGLVENIQKRGRPYELGLKKDYLSSINAAYAQYFAQRPNLNIHYIDTEEVDILNSKEDFDHILGLLKA